MAQPYIGEIRMFGGNFAPIGWAYCDGATLPISEHDALFNLIGTTYGGDGQETFQLPDLRGRAPVHMGQGPGILQNYQLGEQGGVEEVTLTIQQIPAHNHAFLTAAGSGTTSTPTGNVLAASPSSATFVEGTSAGQTLAPGALQPQGGSQPHSNMMPYTVVNYIIALEGVFPHT